MQFPKLSKKDLRSDQLYISIGYVVIAIVAMMTFFLLHDHIDSAMEEAELFAQNQSNQIAAEVVERFENYEKICNILCTTPDAVQYAKACQSDVKSEMLTWSYELTKELNYTVSLYNANIKNLAYYFPPNDSMVTMAQWYEPGSAETFFRIYGLDKQLLPQITTDRGFALSLNPDGSGWMICRTRAYGNYVGYILLMFDLSAYAERIVPDNAFLLLGTDAECSFASQPGLTDEQYRQLVDGAKSGGLFSCANGTYIGCSAALPVGGLTAYTAVHLEKFSDLQTLFRLVSITTGTVCVLSVAALAFYLEKRVFEPMRSLIKTTKKPSRSTQEAIDLVKEEYLSLVQETEVIKEELGDLKPLGLGTLLMQLMDADSTFVSSGNIRKCMHIAGLQENEGYAAFAVCCVDDAETVIRQMSPKYPSEDKPSVMYFALNSALRECLGPYYSGAVAPITGRGYLVFARCRGKDDRQKIEAGVRNLKDSFDSYFHLEIITTHLATGEGAEDFARSVADVCNELAYLEFWRTDVMREEALGSTDAFYYRKLLKTFTNRLNARNYEGAMEAFEDILSTGIPTQVENLDLTKFRIYGITSMLNTVIDEQFGTDRQFVQRLNVEERMFRLDTMDAFRAEVRAILAEVVEHQQTKNDKGAAQGQSAEQIKEYIGQHYCENELSLSTVAEQFGMSDAHLSRLFKQSFGINLLEYIQRLRVEKAKQLLAESSVKETAAAVGFWDTQSLTRAFKKFEGVTPGDYKKTLSE